MNLEKVGIASPLNTTSLAGQHRTLMQRMEQAVDIPSTKPPPSFDIKPIPPDPKEVVKEMVKNYWNGEFMRAMIFGDEEKLGPKPDQD